MIKTICCALFAYAFILCICPNDVEALNSLRNRTTIKDFPLEVLLNIHEFCDINELDNLSKIDALNKRAAEITFSMKYGRKLLMIGENGVSVEPKYESHGPVKIADKETMYSILKQFGNVITNLRISYNYFKESEWKKLNEHINKYVGKSLKEMYLQYFDAENVINLRGPFKNVEIVRFQGSIKSNTINLLDMFPAVRSMYFWDVTNYHPNVIEHHFPHLEEITEWTGYNGSIINLLQLNPQLLKLHVNQVYYGFLKNLSDISPNLQSLEIDRISGEILTKEYENIHFGSLKSLKIDGTFWFNSNTEPLPIVCPKLEQFQSYNLDDVIFNIVKQHKTLTKVTFSYINDKFFAQIIDELPNLEEFTTQEPIEHTTKIEKYVQFIERATNLKRITLYHCLAEAQNAIWERIKNEWDIIKYPNEYYVTFVRR